MISGDMNMPDHKSWATGYGKAPKIVLALMHIVKQQPKAMALRGQGRGLLMLPSKATAVHGQAAASACLADADLHMLWEVDS